MPTVPLAHTVADILKLYYARVITKKNWIDISRNYRNYYFATLMESRFRKEDKNNESFRFTYKTGSYRNGVWDHYGNPDSVDRQNVADYGTAYWSMYKTSWTFDVREPGAFGGTSADQIANHLAMQRANFEQGVFDDFEQAFWTLAPAPNDGTGGSITMNGLPYFVVKSTATTNEAVGNNGGHPSGYSSVFGKSRTSFPQLKNYTGCYTDVTDDDLLAKMNDMLELMRWAAPRSVANEIVTSNQYEIVSHRTPLKQYQQLLRASNENVGMDAGKYYGREVGAASVFRSVPWNWTDALTSQYLKDDGVTANPAYDSTQPIYMLNWDTMDLVGASDQWMKETEPQQVDNPHNTAVGHLDSTQQAICIDPRQNGVLHKSS